MTVTTDSSSRKNHATTYVVIVALLAIAGSLAAILRPFVSDRVIQGERAAAVEKEVAQLQREVNEAKGAHANLVTRAELVLVLEQVKENQRETIRRLERIEDRLGKQGGKP